MNSLLLFYAIATVFQLYHGNDMMYEREGIFNLPHHIGMVWEEPAFDDVVAYISRGNEL